MQGKSAGGYGTSPSVGEAAAGADAAAGVAAVVATVVVAAAAMGGALLGKLDAASGSGAGLASWGGVDAANFGATSASELDDDDVG